MNYGRCAVKAKPRRRSAGAEVVVAVRAARSDVIELIHELAASIGMTVVLSPPDRGEG